MAATTKKKKASTKDLRDKLVGPIKVYLDSDERNLDGSIIMEEFELVDGSTASRPKREDEPFLEEVYYRKYHMTPGFEEASIDLRNSDTFSGRPLAASIENMCKLVAKWDLCDDDGDPIPLTPEGVKKADVQAEIIYAVISAVYEHKNPPKALSGKLPNSSLVEDLTVVSRTSTVQ